MQKFMVKILMCCVCYVGAVQAATIQITSTIDIGGVCVTTISCNSLRAGIAQAVDGDILTIPSGTILLSSPLVITKGLELQGVGGTGLVILDGNNSQRVIDFSPTSATSVLRLIDIQIQNGRSSDGLGGAGLLIRQGLVSIQSTTFFNNTTSLGNGGAIMNNGTLNVKRSTFVQNSAVAGAAIYIASLSDLKLHYSTLVSNNSVGAAISVNGTFTSEASLFHNSLDCSGTGLITSQGYNVEAAQSCGFSTGTLTPDFINISILPVASTLSNAGNTQVLVPLTTQTSIVDQGSSTCTGFDQVGTAVPQNTRCDIGAVEVASANPVTNPTPINNNNDNEDDDDGEGIGAFDLYLILLMFGLFLTVKHQRKAFV